MEKIWMVSVTYWPSEMGHMSWELEKECVSVILFNDTVSTPIR